MNVPTTYVPFTEGDVVLIQKDPFSEKGAPDFYCVRIQEILLEETGEYNEDIKQYEHQVVLRVVDKHAINSNGEYVSRRLYPDFVVGIIDRNEDLDELFSLDLTKFYKSKHVPTKEEEPI